MGLFSKKKFTRHKCKDGTIKNIYNDIDEAFPLALKDNAKKIDLSTEVDQLAKLNLNAEFASQIKGLLYYIDDQNKNLMVNFRTVYAIFASDPCGDNGFLQRESSKLIDGQQKLMELKTQIQGLIVLAQTPTIDHKKILKAYWNIISRLDGKFLPESANAEIKQSVGDYKKMIGGK